MHAERASAGLRGSEPRCVHAERASAGLRGSEPRCVYAETVSAGIAVITAGISASDKSRCPGFLLSGSN